MVNNAVFRTVPLTGKSLLQRVFKQWPQDDAIREVNNLLAATPLLQISREDVGAIEQRYGVNLLREYGLNLEEFYAVYFAALLADQVLTVEESQELAHLQAVLGLDAVVCQTLRGKIGAGVYRKAFEEAVAGRRLPKERAGALSQLASSLQLPAGIAEEISLQARRKPVSDFIQHLGTKSRLSPLDEQELAAMGGSLGVNAWADAAQARLLGEWKQYWELENLPLPIVEPAVPLQKGEVCHLEIKNARWLEGSRLVDSGTLCLTSKRVLLTGLQKNSNVRLEKITDVKTSGQGILLMKDAGKNPTLVLPVDNTPFVIILQKLIVELH